jgi:ABC-type branched-subunit amino acid transport system ATPase component
MTKSMEKNVSPILEVTGLAHAFGGLTVLDGVNFSVASGQVTALIGPNGSGKSTCFNIVSGFLQPDQGSVFLNGNDISSLLVHQRCDLGMVRTFQTPKIFGHLSVLDNLRSGSYRLGASGWVDNLLQTFSAQKDQDLATEKALAMAKWFGLTRLLDTNAGLLPAGQQRMVELARAMASNPSVLLLDEPSSGLSSSEIQELRERILALCDLGVSVLLVSHDLGLAAIASQVHVLCVGRIIASGAMGEIEQNMQVRMAYLGI